MAEDAAEWFGAKVPNAETQEARLKSRASWFMRLSSLPAVC
jgi:hypothetical protein